MKERRREVALNLGKDLEDSSVASGSLLARLDGGDNFLVATMSNQSHQNTGGMGCMGKELTVKRRSIWAEISTAVSLDQLEPS